jgi:hypothetical protein
MAIDKETLRLEYTALIGYDPFEDDPTMTADEVGEIIADYKHNVTLYGDVTDGGFGPYVPDLAQTRADVDCEPDTYPGWHSLQSATRDAW